jgi:membrane-associated phospholipid phosphatase
MVINKPFYRLADAASYIFHPAVLMLLTVVLFSSQFRTNKLLVLADVAILITGILPGFLYVYIKTRQGHFTHYHMIRKEERRIAFPLIFIGLVGSFLVYLLIQAPQIMLQDMLISLLVGVGFLIITRFWKISAHSAVAMICAALFLSFSIPIMLIIMTMGFLVGCSRLLVQHHTPSQVIGGWAYGFITTALLIWLVSLPHL